MLIATFGHAHGLDYRKYPALLALVEVMEREDGYPRAELAALLATATIDQSVLRAMDKQYEALPWHKYRKLFVSEARIAGGAGWWRKNEGLLQRATREYGVPAEIIAAIIGVETNYGATLGKKRVLDSLVTLTAAYPRRSKFFGRELRAFLNIVREEGIDPGGVYGSYAGAMGIPQFIPTSYREYAVDLNGNGRRDLAGEVGDAIGSVANYLKRHGWREGQAVYELLAAGIPADAAGLVTDKSKPSLRLSQLTAAGLELSGEAASEKMALLRFQEADGHQYIVAYRNFYVITRYNHSKNYALAVAELAEAIRGRYGG